VGLLSIKQLTILGFSFVAFPLFFSLLYSVNQINQLSQQGTNAIFDVAKVIKTNRELRGSLNEMQRYASQYLVLKDSDLLDKFFLHEASV
jgi:two-component system sensor histidine kinase GlrK